MHSVIFYNEDGRIMGVTHCAPDHSELQRPINGWRALVLETHFTGKHSDWRIIDGQLVAATGPDNEH